MICRIKIIKRIYKHKQDLLLSLNETRNVRHAATVEEYQGRKDRNRMCQSLCALGLAGLA